MGQHRAVEIVLAARIVAIIRLDDLKPAVDLVQSLLRAGVRAIEFTLTNSQAPQTIETLMNHFEDFRNGTATLGLGSVRNGSEVQAAIDCGAQFVVSPISDRAIIQQAAGAGLAVFPGALTPTEVLQAAQWGADLVKVFPARAFGPQYIKDLLAPMPYLKLMPTGGIDLQNMASYFKAGALAVGVGGQLVDGQLIRSGNWQALTDIAAQYVSLARPA
jgi:2-dehydro-3-deoxyphosphogluconate aldolase/(4S)-4-hydroxy-2-oxoglutarate aldolase